ncbi:MAG TPA: hypothetical protein VLM11_04040 [Streptosporangiaceae bacterium]|nr:hypothetical protein [Streptosporangiaceae bacterium]
MTTPDTRDARTISSEVTVGVDPQTAFSIFTDEIDLWWVRGPINFHDAARAVGMRCEPGVGGRLLELYNADADDALVLGHITTWQPGELLAWQSGVDDVSVAVRFQAVADGTKVTVTATIPAGGADRGGTAWVRVVPSWLGAWSARRDTAARAPVETGRLGLGIYYAKPVAAARWLAEAFSLELPDRLADQDSPEHTWIEFRVGNCSVMLFRQEADGTEAMTVTHVPWVFVDRLDEHLARARSRGATILTEIHQYGYRSYEAADLEGHHWTFAQARPTQ